MELRNYYSRIEEIEDAIDSPDVVIVSEQTSDGGRAGVISEVPRSTGARLIAESRARLASPAEAAAYHEQVHRALQATREDATAGEAARDGEFSRSPKKSPRTGRG